MIPARDVRLVRVPHLRAAHRALSVLARAGSPTDVRDRVFVLPTRHAAAELRRTLERLAWPGAGTAPRCEAWPDEIASVLGVVGVSPGPVAFWPAFLTRSGFHEELHRRLGAEAPPLLARAEREALVWRASDEAVAAGLQPPFTVRPGLIAETLSLYDALRRVGRVVADFERVMTAALEPSTEIDRGAARLLTQTRYLAAVFSRYQELVDASGQLDEHNLRQLLLASAPAAPVTHVVLTVGDQPAEPDGLWPADFDMLTRLPGLARIDVVATASMLDAGLRVRLYDVLPGIEECAVASLGDEGGARLVVAPGAPRRYAVSRDREEELVAIAGEVVTGDLPPADDLLVIYERPLPYVYLARRVFGEAGVPVTSADALPLAAEPYAAAIDLVLEAALSGVAREPLVRLLASPVLSWREDRAPLSPAESQAFREWCRDTGFRGGAAELSRIAASRDAGAADATRGGRRDRHAPPRTALERALQAARAAAQDLATLDREVPLTVHLSSLLALLHARQADGYQVLEERSARARAAALGLLEQLGAAYARHGDRVVELRDAVPVVRRAFEQHTFAPLDEGDGVRFVDARSARYADAAAAWVVGVVEGEWPRASRRSVFYPSSLLRDLGFPSEQDRLPAARAAFHDLLALARDRTSVSAFQLEEDAIVRPSVLLEDLDDLAVREGSPRPMPSPRDDAGGEEVRRSHTPEASHAWMAWRAERRAAAGIAPIPGRVGPRAPRTASVTHVERYLDCPFKYFALHVLELDEEDEPDPVGLEPQRRGTLVHEAFRSFFDTWRTSGQGAITAASLDAARRAWEATVDSVLATLPAADQVIERARLIGSAGAIGLGERVFRLEATRPATVVERLLEFELRGTFDFGPDAATVVLRGVADRIDLLADGTFRLVDYKTGRAPEKDRAIQLAVYALCAEQRLRGRRGREWRVGEAAYIALADHRPWVAVVRSADDRRPLEAGRARFLEALDGIARGEFPVAPADRRLCATCAFAAVCRKEYRADLA